MDLSLQQTSLEQLKNQISNQKSIEPKYQRLFHLGRELKNCRRSLKALGIGNYNSFVIHLQSNQPKDHVFSSNNSSASCAKLKSSANNTTTTTTTVTTTSSSATKRKRRRNETLSTTTMTTITASSIQHPNNRNNNANEKMIVNLLDSDDDDDDDDEIEVVEVKRTMKHNRTR